jgi:hypothetical protein
MHYPLVIVRFSREELLSQDFVRYEESLTDFAVKSVSSTAAVE